MTRADADRLLSPLAGRAIALLALVAFGALHWMQMLDPPVATRAWYATGIALLTALGLIGAARLAGPRRIAALAVTLAAGAGLSVLAAGGADELLAPANWNELAGGVARGVDAVPGARVPYRGLDEWLRLVIPLGGTVLAFACTVIAFWPRRNGETGHPAPALIGLVALYAVPSVAQDFQTESLRGAVLAVLVLAFLRLERLPRRDGRGAAIAATAAAMAALALAPALDRDLPWWDYESWALSAAGSRSTDFFWDHRYDQPLDWPRDGRELLRVKAKRGTYWKADNLDFFDGRRWERDEESYAQQSDSYFLDMVEIANVRRWSDDLAVTIRNLRTETFVLPGMVTGADIRLPRRGAFSSGRPGVFRTTRTLHRGDTYRVTGAYVPQASSRELRRAGDAYSVELLRFTRLDVVPGEQFSAGPGSTISAGAPRRMSFPGFGEAPVTPEEMQLELLRGRKTEAMRILEASDLDRTWALAQEMREDSRTPFDYLRAVQRFLGEGFAYTEVPPKEAATLDGFLFDAKAGYCQQYSGAMTLLLRMAGIPARVATGFSAGTFDKDTGEFVVRDYDAHSWVEAWFPGIGWVTFDPTPSSAPPRAQGLTEAAASQAIGDIRDLGTATFDPRRDGSGDTTRNWLAYGALALAGLGGGGFAVTRVRRRRRRTRPAQEDGPLAELRRALRIAGDGLAPATTLTALERRFEQSPEAGAYLRALREQRYGVAPNGGPSTEQRAGLRSALATGRGVPGRLRAWWALPPRLRH